MAHLATTRARIRRGWADWRDRERGLRRLVPALVGLMGLMWSWGVSSALLTGAAAAGSSAPGWLLVATPLAWLGARLALARPTRRPWAVATALALDSGFALTGYVLLRPGNDALAVLAYLPLSLIAFQLPVRRAVPPLLGHVALTLGADLLITYPEQPMATLGLLLTMALAVPQILLVAHLDQSRDRLEVDHRQRLAELARANAALRATEAALRTSDERLRLLVDTLPVVLFAIDRDGIFTHSDGRGLVDLGLRPGQAVGRSVFELYADQPAITRAVRRALAGEAVVETTTVAGRDYDTHLAPIHAANGALTGLIGLALDVTERLRAETARRISEARLRAAIEASPDAVFMLRCDRAADGRVVDFTFEDANHVAERVLGRGREQLIGRRLRALPPINRAGSSFDAYAGVVERGQPLEQEFAAVASDRPPRWLHQQVVPLADGIAVTLRDITVRKQAEHAQRLLAEVGAVLAHSLDVDVTPRTLADICIRESADYCLIDIIDDEHRHRSLTVAHADERRAAIVRRQRERHPIDLQGANAVATAVRTARPLLIAEVTDAILDQLALTPDHRRAIVDLGFRSSITVPLLTRGRCIGVLQWISAESGRRYGPADLELATEVGRRAAGAIDTAQLYQASRAALTDLRASQAQLVQAGKLAAVGTLAAGVAHELNQPLMVIRGQAQLLLADGDDPARRAEKLRRIERQTGKMTAIIDHLRAFGRTSRPGDGQPVELRPVVDEALGLIASQLSERDITLIRRHAPHLPPAWADPNEVEQIVLNLVLNARDAIEQGGTITISTDRADGHCLVTVVDTGRGLAPAAAARLFEPFFTTKEVGKGTGLGLSISRDIARRWGGDLAVANRGDGRPGAVARLTLPIRPAVAPWPDSDRCATEAGARRHA